MFNLARKIKEIIFNDNNNSDDEFNTQQTVNNDTKVFSSQNIEDIQSVGNDSTLIREPMSRKEVRLKLLNQDQLTKEFNIDAVETNIGRQKSNEVVLKDKSVSRVHAQLINKKYYYKVRDLSSTNGLYVNGELVKEKKLSNGDKIRLGESVLEFILDD